MTIKLITFVTTRDQLSATTMESLPLHAKPDSKASQKKWIVIALAIVIIVAIAIAVPVALTGGSDAESDNALTAESDAESDDAQTAGPTAGSDCKLATRDDTDRSLDYDQAWFRVEGEILHMTDTIDGTTPGRFEQAMRCHPEAKRIVMGSVPGSADDVANVQVAKLAHENGYTTELLATSLVASGGTDFLLAGVSRTIESGACIGVHSWAGGETTVPAVDLPRDHPEHKKYLDLYTLFGIDNGFYWFTLAAAPADGMHYMTQAELEQWNVGTSYLANSNAAQLASCSERAENLRL